MKSPKILNQGIVFSGPEGSDRQSATFPGVSLLSDGSWVCTFRAAPRKGDLAGQRVLMTRSRDEGRSWSEPRDCFDPPRIGHKPGSFRTGFLTQTSNEDLIAVLCWVDQSKPSLPFYNEETEGLLDTRIFLSRSNDRGETWSLPALVETPPWDVPTPITGPILEFGNGDLGCQFELNKEYLDPAPWSHKSVIQISRDKGATWPESQVVSNDPRNRVFYWDQRPAVLRSQKVLDLFWTFDRESGTYLPIHACESLDHGKTWSEIWNTGVSGQPAPPVELEDGTTVMVFMDRTGVPTLKARISTDQGRTWPLESESVLDSSTERPLRNQSQEMNEAWSEMSAFSMGLPATARLSDREFLVVFYVGPRTDVTAIRWIRCCIS